MSRPVHCSRRPAAALLGVALVVTASCSNSVDESGGVDSRPVAMAEAQPAVIGETVTADGIEVQVRSVESYPRSPEAFPRLRLIMRSRNVGDHDADNPEVGLLCDESDAIGEWHLGSTWEAAGFLPEGSVSEGEILVAFPAKPGERFYPLAECTNPRIRIVIGDGVTLGEVFEVPIEPDLIDDALTEPLGPRFPLPTVSP